MKISLAGLLGALAGAFADTSPVVGEEVLALRLEAPFQTTTNYWFGGSAVLSKRVVRLTGDAQGERGWISTRGALLPETFQVEVDLLIHGQMRALYGDGMAFWFLPQFQGLQEGPVFGVQDFLPATAVVIDTYRNHRPGKVFPLVMLMHNDGKEPYDAANDGLANQLDACSARGLHNAEGVTKIRIRYDGIFFSVELNYRNKWEKCINQELALGDRRKFAISASTGQLTENHDLLGIRVYHVPRATAPPIQMTRPLLKRSGSWSWRLAKLAVVGAILFGGWRLYVRRMRYAHANDPFKYL